MVTARMPARSAAAIWLRISASSGEMITVGPAPCGAQQQRGDEVDRRLAPAGALHDQRPPPVDHQRLDRASTGRRAAARRRCADQRAQVVLGLLGARLGPAVHAVLSVSDHRRRRRRSAPAPSSLVSEPTRDGHVVDEPLVDAAPARSAQVVRCSSGRSREAGVRIAARAGLRAEQRRRRGTRAPHRRPRSPRRRRPQRAVGPALARWYDGHDPAAPRPAAASQLADGAALRRQAATTRRPPVSASTAQIVRAVRRGQHQPLEAAGGAAATPVTARPLPRATGRPEPAAGRGWRRAPSAYSAARSSPQR